MSTGWQVKLENKIWSCLSGMIWISCEFHHMEIIWNDLKRKISPPKLSGFGKVAVGLCQRGNGTIRKSSGASPSKLVGDGKEPSREPKGLDKQARSTFGVSFQITENINTKRRLRKRKKGPKKREKVEL